MSNEASSIFKEGRPSRKLNILILAGFVRSLDWSETLWAPDLAHALAARGHRVEVALDGCDDPALFDGLPLLVHRPNRRHFGAEPFLFRYWARSLLKARPDRVCLSLTPLICGDVWLPIGTRANEVVSRILAESSPVAVAMELVHHPWLLHELLAERRAAKDTPRRRVQPLTIGPHAEKSSLRSLGYAARSNPIIGAERDAVRCEVRERLSLQDSDRVFLLSGTHADEHTSANLLEALALLERVATPSRMMANGDQPQSAPRLRLIVTGRFPHMLHTLARRAGCAHSVVFAGTRVNMARLLAASDIAIAAFGTQGLGTGRFACEAIRAGVPLLAGLHAPGSDLVDTGLHKPGEIVREDTREGWLGALGKILDDRWMAEARAAAASVGADLTVSRLIARLESYLLGALR
ncbi:MAG: glycosyltransferase [Phycisphaeraceae bacterium]|nr:glycosyltransferase [Phycisphaeraceae bacterium]